MEPDPPPVDPVLIPDAGLEAELLEPGAAVLIGSLRVNLGLLLLPAAMLLTARVKLRRFPDLRTLHTGLALASAAALALAGFSVFLPSLIPDGLRQQGLLSFAWVFLYAWMALDFLRSARRTGLRPRLTDALVILLALSTAAGVVLTFLPA